MIKAQVVYSTEHFRSLNRSINRVRLPLNIAYRLGATLYFVSLGMILYWYFRNINNKLLLIAMLGMCALAAFMEVKCLISLKNFDAEADKIPVTGENRLFVFDENGEAFTEFITDENENTRKTFPYSHLYRAEENDRFFLIFIRKHLACIVGKHEITEGSPAQLRELLSQRLGDRFTVRKGER